MLKNRKGLVAYRYSLQRLRKSKFQISKFAYPALPLFYSLLSRVIPRKESYCCDTWCVHLWYLIYPFRFVTFRFAKYSKPFAKYRFSNLHILHFRCRIYIPCLGYRTKWIRLLWYFSTDLFISFRFVSQNTVSPSKSSFRKIPIFEFAYSALLVWVIARRESDCCDTWYVLFSTDLFISFRFAKYSKLESLY